MPLIDLIKIKLTVTLLLAICCFTVLARHPLDNPEKESFRFFINADPQMGDIQTKAYFLPTLNQLLKDFVSDINQKHEKNPIDFVVYNGDLVWKPKQNAFENFQKIVSKQNPPTVLVHGNHDGRKGDEGFVGVQQALSGYQQLNYTFEYGDWMFLVLSAQEMYPGKKDKIDVLTWLDQQLKKTTDKQVMVFMHYHLIPMGLSQLEYYSYSPLSFRNQLLNTITRYGNVKYVFSGHVHTGVKASIKSSKKFRGTVFVNTPTPVMARPFGEEYIEYEDKPESFDFRRGFYLEVNVKGSRVELIGHKIKHPHQVKYPEKFDVLNQSDDPRFFVAESAAQPNSTLINYSFNEGIQGWNKSFRYTKDQDNAFENIVINGSNNLKLTAPWGSWNKDEYMETYQTVELDMSTNPTIEYSFYHPKWSENGAGGYFRVTLYDENQKREKMILFHWGSDEKKVVNMPQSWFFNSDGQRVSLSFIQRELNKKNLLSFKLKFDSQEQQLSINLKNLLTAIEPQIKLSKINKMTLAHGVWTAINGKKQTTKSQLTVNEVKVVNMNKRLPYIINYNGQQLTLENLDRQLPYFFRR